MKKLLSEALGTFGLVFFGTGAIVVDGETSAALGVAGPKPVAARKMAPILSRGFRQKRGYCSILLRRKRKRG